MANQLDLFNKYKDVFTGLGLLKNTKCKLELQPDSTPRVETCRNVPSHLAQVFKNELQRMIDLKVIEPVKGSSEWDNSFVFIKTSDGKRKIGMDARNLNNVLRMQRPQHKLPDHMDCQMKMFGAKIFSLLRVESGFWTIPLDETSSRLCTFSTPFGRYRFLRLPIGVKSAGNVFQDEMIRLFGNIKGLIIYLEEFFIFAPTMQEHNLIIEKILMKARDVGLKFNFEASKIGRTEMQFMGCLFTEAGVMPDLERIQKSLNMYSAGM